MKIVIHLVWLKLARTLLSLRNLLRRQLTFQHGHVLLGILIALPGRQQQPLVSLDNPSLHLRRVRSEPRLY